MSTPSSRPWTSVSRAGSGRGRTTEGEGSGRAPLQGAEPSPPDSSAHSPSPQGTIRTRERGSRPGTILGTWTVPAPMRDSTRSAARRARASACCPGACHSPAWAAAAGLSSRAVRLRWISPEEGGRPERPESQPSSCQRTRSVSSMVVGVVSSIQVRTSSAPSAQRASMARRPTARPSDRSRAARVSARCRAAKAAVSVRSTGGSRVEVTAMSWAGRVMAGASWWVPAARWWSRSPRGPKRAVTSFPGRAARSARVRSPSRAKVSSRGRASRRRRLRGRQARSESRGQGARKSGVRPGSTMRP